MRVVLDFVKYHGCGNDFILVDEMDGQPIPDDRRSALAQLLCDRHFAVGADGIIFIEPAEGCDGSMRLFEPAGNEADMCGNGLRCVASVLSDKLGKDTLSILTRDGVKMVSKVGEDFKVDMGPVRTLRRDLAAYISDGGQPTDSMIDISLSHAETLEVERVSILNTGEPHIVAFVRDLSSIDAVGIGTSLNSDTARFPRGININFVQILGPGEVSIRTYERGVYNETMACGTGATACAAAFILSGKAGEEGVKVQTRGGPLVIELTEEGRAFMTGPATRVFAGRVEADV